MVSASSHKGVLFRGNKTKGRVEYVLAWILIVAMYGGFTFVRHFMHIISRSYIYCFRFSQLLRTLKNPVRVVGPLVV